MAITNKTAIENYLLIQIDATFNDQIAEWIEAVEQEMNKMANRKLIADEEPVTFKYDGQNRCDLIIDDFVSIEEVKLGETEITDDCHFYPANSTPKWKIRASRTLPEYPQSVSVTGIQGYCTAETLPADLKLAATVLVAGIINYSRKPKGEVKSETIGRWTVTYSGQQGWADFKSAKDIIMRYRRYW